MASTQLAKHKHTKTNYTDISHSGPGTLAGRYLRTFWHPVYRSQDLQPGRAMPLRVMSEDFTLYRGKSGRAQVLAPRCAHRGTQLSIGRVEDDCISCFYHGWKYDPTGQCVAQPAEDKSFAHKVKIRSYPTQEYLGLIFAYLGDSPAPELPRYPLFEDFDQELCIRFVQKLIKRFNFRNGVENAVDPVHIAFVHRQSGYNVLVGVPQVVAEETDYGMQIRATRPNGSVRVTHWQMPAMILTKQGPRDPLETGWRDNLLWRSIIDDESHLHLSVKLVYVPKENRQRFIEKQEEIIAKNAAEDAELQLASQVLSGKVDIADIGNSQQLVAVQDLVSMRGQGVIYDPTPESEHLGCSDAGVILLRKLYAREMRALAVGKPLKRWGTVQAEVTTGI